MCSRIPDVIITLCQLAAASLFLLAMAPKLLWLLLIFMIVAVVGSRMFFKVIQELTRKIRSKDGEIQQYMQENLLNRVLVLTLVGSERVLEKLGWMQKDVRDNTVKRLNYNAVARGFMHFGFIAGYAAAFLWGVLGIKDGTVTYGMMTAFLQLVGQVQRPIADLSRHVPAFIHAMVSVERIMDLQNLELEEKEEPILLSGAPGIDVKDLSFSYPDQNRTAGLHPPRGRSRQIRGLVPDVRRCDETARGDRRGQRDRRAGLRDSCRGGGGRVPGSLYRGREHDRRVQTLRTEPGPHRNL